MTPVPFRTLLPGFAAIFAAVFAAYLPALRGGLIWNDADYVTKPALASAAGLWRIWTEVGATEQYYPLLHSFFWLQHQLWGNAPLGHHVVNLLLHATAACLLGVIVVRLAPQTAGSRHVPLVAGTIAAALFALHPVMAESAAWISEQKNTLSTVLYLAAALAYLHHDQAKNDNPHPDPLGPKGSGCGLSLSGGARGYLPASALFVAALLSKSVTASLPAALLVVFWWKRGRLGKGDVIPLLPWFFAGAGVGLFTAYVEHKYIGAHGADFELSFLQRGLLAGRIIWFYLGKLVWPEELIFIYPRWEVSTADPRQWVYPAATVALAVLLWLLRHRARGPLAAYLYFVGTLFPTLGFFNVYAFKFSFVADHWQYLPAAGILAAMAISIAALAGERLHAGGGRVALAVLVVALLGALGTKTFRQAEGYRDMETFYRRIIARNPGSWLAQYNLGEMLMNQGRFAEAEGPLRESLRSRPQNADGFENLAVTLLKLQRPLEALPQFEQVFRLRAPDAGLHVNTGSALAASGQFAAGAAHFAEAVRLNPAYADAHELLARALDILGKPSEAASHRETAARLKREKNP